MDTKRIFVLGNGFDLAHYLPTAYVYFMDAMMVVESCQEVQELGFDSLFQKYITGECSDRDKDFFTKTKKLYKTDDWRLSTDTVNDLQAKLKDNGWFQHFKNHLTDVDTWIDFETEIENVLLSINTLLSKDFDSSTISEVDVKVDVSPEYGETYQTNKADFDSFLGDNLVQFSPRYLNEMRFKSSKVQRILRSFSITSKSYGSCEEVKDYGMSKIVNFKSHDSHGAREKTKFHKKYRDSLFITFDIDRVVKKKYLDRFSSFYTGFKADELFKRLSADLECLSEIFTKYINVIINQLEPAKPFDIFDGLAKEIDAVHTFNYSNTFERLYPNIFVDKYNNVQYIHGSAERKNIVLGISDLEEELKKYKIYGFVKAFQKLIKNTDYKFLDNTDIKVVKSIPREAGQLRAHYEVVIWGHSLDASDAEYIQEMFALNDSRMLNRVVIKIWYHSSPHVQLANLMHIMGKDVIQEWMKKDWLVFETAPDIHAENKKAEKS